MLIVFVLLVGGAVTLFTSVGQIWFKKTFGVWNEDVNRQVFTQTQSYVQGKIQRLADAHHEWVNADELGKKSIESVVRSEFADFDASKVTDADLRAFLYTARAHKVNPRSRSPHHEEEPKGLHSH